MLPMNKFAVPLLFLIAAALPAQAQAAPGACGDHPWLRTPPANVEAEHPAPLYLEVQPGARDEAVKLLEQRAAMRITPEQAARFTGETAESWVPGLTYLLRRVRNPDTDSRYAISYGEDGAVVVHFAARRPGKPYSAPMVAVLEQPPAALYVSCVAGQ
jgi:hypothetical protein